MSDVLLTLKIAILPSAVPQSAICDMPSVPISAEYTCMFACSKTALCFFNSVFGSVSEHCVVPNGLVIEI